MSLPAGTVATIAEAARVALAGGPQIAPFSRHYPELDRADASAAAAALRGLRIARGEQPVGRKIGFTNRGIWAEYGVDSPIWGDMFDTTVHALTAAPVTLAGFAEPQIEPEIAFKLRAAPSPEMDEPALLACVEWVAHGFEIVQSIFPGWRFASSDCIVAGGLHGAYLYGPPTPIAAGDRSRWLAELGSFEIELLRDGEVVDRGRGANVLDHPLSALRHLVMLLRDDPHNPPLGPGEIITTGTLTRAFPVRPGQCWSTRLHGLALEGIAIRFA